MTPRPTSTARCGDRRDSGTGMIEVLVSITLISTIVLATIAANWSNARTGNVHRASAIADTVLRSTAESILSPATAYVMCATPSNYAPALASDPSGTVVVTIAAVTYWNGASPPSYTPTCGSDKGAARITLRATSVRTGSTQTLDIIKRSSQ